MTRWHGPRSSIDDAGYCVTGAVTRIDLSQWVET
jgi:hypothetical protein